MTQYFKNHFRGSLLVLGAVLAAGLPATELQAEDDWDIEDAKAPTWRFDQTLSEGTWISVDVSPDGKNIAFDLLGHVFEMPITGGEARALTAGRSWNLHPRYSPDGQRIAFTSDRSGSHDLWVMDRASGDVSNLSRRQGTVTRPAWSFDSRHLYGMALEDNASNSALQYSFYGSSESLLKTDTFTFINALQADAGGQLLFYEHNDRKFPHSGARIKTYDLVTGNTEVLVERVGGAFNPRLSPDGKLLAFMGRDDLQTTLYLQDMETHGRRTLVANLDRDHMENNNDFHGIYPAIAWHPDGRSLYFWSGGQINVVDIATAATQVVPFAARLQREINQTLRFPVPVPAGTTATRIHRWAQPTSKGILFETLGDLYLNTPGGVRQLTDTPAHETSPVLDEENETLYYAAWTDQDLGSLYRQSLRGGPREKLTDRATTYGSVSLSNDGRYLAYLRGRDDLRSGARLEGQEHFELMLRDASGQTRTLVDVPWVWSSTATYEVQRPPAIVFSPDHERIYFTVYKEKTLYLKSIRLDGLDELTLYEFPNGSRALPSPDLAWIALREYHRTYLVPMDFAGKTIRLVGSDANSGAIRVSHQDGDYVGWTSDSNGLFWTRGKDFHELPLAGVMAGKRGAAPRDISQPVKVAAPQSVIALTNARVLTMDTSRQVYENATILVKNSDIIAVGNDVTVPAAAKVFDLAGRTVVPGFVDSHGHYGGIMSTLNIVEQQISGLLAPLAYGVTTLYEVYGHPEKDFWISDMIRAGRMKGPRLFSVGTPVFGVKQFRPGLYRELSVYQDAEEVVSYNKDFGATSLKDYANFDRGRRHRLATAARNLGLNIVSESAQNLQMNLSQVVDGMSGIEHSMGTTPLYADVLALFSASKIGITPTLGVVYNGPRGETYFHQRERLWTDPKLLNFMPREELLTYRRPTHYWEDDHYAPIMAVEMHKLKEAGVSIQTGGHGQMYGLDMHWEMELLVQGGFEPMEAIEAATIAGATYHGLDADIGSIEAGKKADLVVLGANPLTDIRNTRAVQWVIKNGVVYDGDTVDRVYPDPAPSAAMYFTPVDVR